MEKGRTGRVLATATLRDGAGSARCAGASVSSQPEPATGTATAAEQAWPTHSQEAFGAGASRSPWS